MAEPKAPRSITIQTTPEIVARLDLLRGLASRSKQAFACVLLGLDAAEKKKMAAR